MKNLIKKTLTFTFIVLGISLMTVSTVAANGGAPRVTFTKVEATKKVTMVLEGLVTDATLQVRNDKGVILLTKTIKNAETFERILSLEQLEAGNYLIVLATPMQDILQPVEITKEGLVLNEAKQKAYYAPAIRVQDRMVDVNLFNSRIADVKLALYDENGEQVFAEKLDNVVQVQKRLNLSELPKGLYTLKVGTPYKAYYKDIRI